MSVKHELWANAEYGACVLVSFRPVCVLTVPNRNMHNITDLCILISTIITLEVPRIIPRYGCFKSQNETV
jgi:hypothetical protein